MDEFKIAGFIVGADHDANMADVAAAAPAGEEHEVAFAEILAFHFLTLEILGAGSRADGIAELLVNVTGEPGAIEGVGTLHTVAVGFADMAVGLLEKVADELCRLGRHIVGFFSFHHLVFQHVADYAGIHAALYIREHLLMHAVVGATGVGMSL